MYTKCDIYKELDFSQTTNCTTSSDVNIHVFHQNTIIAFLLFSKIQQNTWQDINALGQLQLNLNRLRPKIEICKKSGSLDLSQAQIL